MAVLEYIVDLVVHGWMDPVHHCQYGSPKSIGQVEAIHHTVMHSFRLIVSLFSSCPRTRIFIYLCGVG